ncbi:SLC13 family permease [Roseimaritima sediminicola]|uniref:SLC13 family permease n=1 Tax=Roseimaritima sediminicola TaxID=2662066 RepID=UPI001F45A104|nr:SLC13 family permease [Roseimaritima sediminicola]
MYRRIQNAMLWAGPLLALLAAGGCLSAGTSVAAAACAAVAVWCALWWVFETVHLAVVGLIPFVAFPLLGVLSAGDVARSYGHSMILLLLGGFFLSAAMERSGAHRRLAVLMVRSVGGSGGRRLVLGFMLATAGLSMWISNTATCLMMLPIAMAVLKQVDGEPRLTNALLLGLAYSASIGGMGTPIGTPPNVMMVAYVQQTFDRDVGFFQWMSVALPIVALLLPVAWLWITRRVQSNVTLQMPPVGRWQSSEIRVLGVFLITALAWVFRTAPYGGWTAVLAIPGEDGRSMVNDSTIALGAALALFILPAGEDLDDRSPDRHDPDRHDPDRHDREEGPRRPRPRLLDWETASRVPWGILIMFGGGLALAAGFEESGLSRILGQQLRLVTDQPLWLLVLAVCLLVTFLTEMTSSTATTSLLLPILGGLALVSGLPYEYILVPATISASCAFMLPVATAPNTIVFGAGRLSTSTMARTGFALNLFAAGLITTACTLLIQPAESSGGDTGSRREAPAAAVRSVP